MGRVKPYWRLLAPLLIRSLQLALPQTFFQPDEFYQALEPAHWLVFGYGHLTWEWRDLPSVITSGYGSVGSRHGIWSILDKVWEVGGWERLYEEVVVGGRMRGWLWPGLVAAVYKLVQVLGKEEWIAVS